MSYTDRYLVQQVRQDLSKKMVFIGGPRQVGKTTLAKHLLVKNHLGYLNWDDPEDREAILRRELPNCSMWVFDEIHKYKLWRNYLKGLYDKQNTQRKILVTGSARLDYYRRGGDSLQGRYHYLRLMPLSVKELGLNNSDDFQTLIKLGGFPEPFFGGVEVEAKRWSREYRQRLLQEDLLSLENVKDINSIELLMLRLPELVGSPLSVNALREELQVSHAAVSQWLMIFERLYAIFRLLPFGSPKIRAVKKEQKHFHYDWSLVLDEGARFENLVAVHLLKWVNYEIDTKARNLELRYFRDIDGREVDFVITEDGRPFQAIECKLSDTSISKHLKYFKHRFPDCDTWQVVCCTSKHFVSEDGIQVANPIEYLSRLI